MEEPNDLDNKLARLKGVSVKRHREQQNDFLVNTIIKEAEQEEYDTKKEKTVLLKNLGITDAMMKLRDLRKENLEDSDFFSRCQSLAGEYKGLGEKMYSASKSKFARWKENGPGYSPTFLPEPSMMLELRRLNEQYLTLQIEVKPARLIKK